MQIKEIFHTQFAHPDFRCSIFPGAAKLSDGSIIMLFVAGDEFESADQKVFKARSLDNGRTWTLEGELYDYSKLDFEFPFTDCLKPTLLDDGTLIAAGYGFLRDRPDMNLSGYAEKFGHFPPSYNHTVRSSDNGRSWTAPEFIRHEYIGMEISGPALKLANGETRFFAAPFGLSESGQKGLCFAGGTAGKNWHEISTFFDGGSIAPWEVRSCQMDSGRIVLVLWAFDLAVQKHLPNKLVYSDDNGQTWSQAIDTQLPGQAANLMPCGEKLLLLQTRREGENCGLYLHELEFDGPGIKVLNSACVMDADNLASAEGRIEKQFCSLKFGQPSLLKIAGNNYLMFYWQAVEDIYKIHIHQLEINCQ